MKTSGLLFLLLMACLGTLAAQKDCAAAYDAALIDYRLGKLEQVVRQLEGCGFDERVNRPLRRDILHLLVETHQFLDDRASADTAFVELLRLDPFFRTNQEVPEMKYIYDAYETYPYTTYTIFTGLHVFTRPVVQQQFDAAGVQTLTESYEREADDLFGWILGADASINLFNSDFDLSFGYTVSTVFYRYRGTLANALQQTTPPKRTNAQVSFLEKQRWSQLPLILHYHFVPNERIIYKSLVPYASFGIAPQFLSRRSTQLKEPFIQFQDVEEPVATNKIDIGEQRNKFNLSVIAGVGFKWHYKRYFSFFDVRYQRLVRNVTDADQRFANTQLTEVYNYLDNDFQIQSLGFRIGLGFFLFKSRGK